MARRAFVIGGIDQIGWAICHDLLAHGWEVTVSHRGQSETLPPAGRFTSIAPSQRHEPAAMRSIRGTLAHPSRSSDPTKICAPISNMA